MRVAPSVGVLCPLSHPPMPPGRPVSSAPVVSFVDDVSLRAYYGQHVSPPDQRKCQQGVAFIRVRGPTWTVGGFVRAEGRHRGAAPRAAGADGGPGTPGTQGPCQLQGMVIGNLT